MEEKDLTFTLVLDEVGAAYLRFDAGVAWVRVFVDQRLDHHLSLLGHNEPREGIPVGLDGMAASDIECFREGAKESGRYVWLAWLGKKEEKNRAQEQGGG